ncbi:hypothetical protein V8F20_008941 [Naviculisporaceae sp. PSN 640]
MPIRNPFARRPGVPTNPSDNASDGSQSANGSALDVAHPGFERVDTVGSKASSGLSIRSSRRSQDTGEYKMSVVNDSGIYLPPSPVEREAVWPRRYLSLSRSSSDTKHSSQGEIEHFSISRESFDSYRRSFDISAKTPITADVAPRQSLDSRFPRASPRSSVLKQQQQELRRFEQREPPTPEEAFEDVGLNDDGKQNVPPKRRGFFSKFGADVTTATPVHHDSTNPSTTTGGGNLQTMSRFLPGRKRGQSGQGAELGAMPISSSERPNTATTLQAQEVQS